MTNVEKCKELGILNDLLENNSEEDINKMDANSILDSWLEWEGIIGYTKNIIKIYEAFREDPDVAEYELCKDELIDFDLPKRDMFRDLSEEEEKIFRQWARDNYEPNTEINTLWHPIIQDECNAINKETEKRTKELKKTARNLRRIDHYLQDSVFAGAWEKSPTISLYSGESGWEGVLRDDPTSFKKAFLQAEIFMLERGITLADIEKEHVLEYE